MEFTKVVAERYSCKNFSTRKVEAEKLTEILEAGRLAPTAKNSQEQRIYVLQSEESLAKLDKVTPCRYGAPTCLVVAFDKNSVFPYGENETSRNEWKRWLPDMEFASLISVQSILPDLHMTEPDVSFVAGMPVLIPMNYVVFRVEKSITVTFPPLKISERAILFACS